MVLVSNSMKFHIKNAAFYGFIFLMAFSSTAFGQEEWKKVYLASFPRSGNHWVRYLVEEATHISTSSVYRDRDIPHLQEKFPWDGFCPDHGYIGTCRYPTKDDPVLLKTHYPCFKKPIDQRTHAAICLIRHPIDAFWSWHVFQQRGNAPPKMDPEKLERFINLWKNFYEFWENQPDVVFIRYEDLFNDTELHLRCILQTAGFSFDDQDIERAIHQHPPQGEILKHLQCFDSEMILLIQERLFDLMEKYNYVL